MTGGKGIWVGGGWSKEQKDERKMYGKVKDRRGGGMLEKARGETDVRGHERNPGQKEQSRKESRRKERDMINSPVFASGTTTGNTCLFFPQPFSLSVFLQPAPSEGHVRIIVSKKTTLHM